MIGAKRKLEYDMPETGKAGETPEAREAGEAGEPMLKRLKSHMIQLHASAAAHKSVNHALCLERDMLEKQNKALRKQLKSERRKIKRLNNMVRTLKEINDEYDRAMAAAERKYRQLQNVLYEERCERYESMI